MEYEGMEEKENETHFQENKKATILSLSATVLGWSQANLDPKLESIIDLEQISQSPIDYLTSQSLYLLMNYLTKKNSHLAALCRRKW